MIWRATYFPPPLLVKVSVLFPVVNKICFTAAENVQFSSCMNQKHTFSPRKMSLRPILPIDLLKEKRKKLCELLCYRGSVRTAASALRHRLTSPITSRFKSTTVRKEAPGSSTLEPCWSHPDKNRPPSRSNTSHDHVCYNHELKLKRHAKICQHLKTQEEENWGWSLAASFLLSSTPDLGASTSLIWPQSDICSGFQGEEL